jgi:Major Facilitator Superfamily
LSTSGTICPDAQPLALPQCRAFQRDRPAIGIDTRALEAVSGRRRKAATLFHAVTLAGFLGASSAPTPLYRLYQESFAFSPVMLTVIFGVYAFALLAALLTVGKLSDHVGRRPVVLGALLVQAIAMALFALATSAGDLILARIVQGFATGAAASAIGAALIDLDGIRGPLTNSVAPLAGMALGAVGAGALVEFAPWPTHLVYVLFLVVFVAQALAIRLVPETARSRPGAFASLAPRVTLPPHLRAAFLRVSPLTVAVWALGGFYLSLVPSLVRAATGSTSHLVAGFVVAVLTLGGATAILVQRNRPAGGIFVVSLLGLVAGLVTLLAAVHLGFVPLVFVGTAMAGVGFGSGFLGASRTLLPLAAPEERAGLLAAFYVLSYVAFSVPAIVAGFVSQSVGLVGTADLYGAGLLVLAGFGFLATLRRAPAMR